MLSLNDFIIKYEQYSDAALVDVHQNIDEYSDEAKEAMQIVLQKKGGLEKIFSTLNEKKLTEYEELRIAKETMHFGKENVDIDFIKTMITSKVLTKERVNEIIESQFVIVEHELMDEKVTAKTILFSIIGIVIASLIGGTLWGLQMIYSHRIFYIFGIGLAFLCFGIIKFVTKKTFKNLAVILATVLSIFLSILFGYLLLSIFGVQE
jgi:hypothetical protein